MEMQFSSSLDRCWISRGNKCGRSPRGELTDGCRWGAAVSFLFVVDWNELGVNRDIDIQTRSTGAGSVKLRRGRRVRATIDG